MSLLHKRKRLLRKLTVPVPDLHCPVSGFDFPIISQRIALVGRYSDLSAVIIFVLGLKLLLSRIVRSWRRKNSDEVKRYFRECRRSDHGISKAELHAFCAGMVRSLRRRRLQTLYRRQYPALVPADPYSASGTDANSVDNFTTAIPGCDDSGDADGMKACRASGVPRSSESEGEAAFARPRSPALVRADTSAFEGCWRRQGGWIQETLGSALMTGADIVASERNLHRRRSAAPPDEGDQIVKATDKKRRPYFL